MSDYYTYYYINADKQKEGPHDLVTMMRRIRSGIIKTQTLVYRGDEDPTSAHVLEELAHFFNSPSQDLRGDLQEDNEISISEYLSAGWDFLSENPMTTVSAGLMLALSGLVGWMLSQTFGILAAVVGFWVMFMLMKSTYLVVSLRLYRGQRTDIVFIDKILSPIFPTLLFLSLVFALLIPVGGIFLIFPALLAILLFVLSAMYMVDHQCNGLEAISESWKLIAKLDRKSKLKICGLVFIYVISMVLVFPIPVMLPIFVGAMCCAYEDFINS